jgi:hypothetical protein
MQRDSLQMGVRLCNMLRESIISDDRRGVIASQWRLVTMGFKGCYGAAADNHFKWHKGCHF